MQPQEEILEQFGVTAVDFLGGRLNRHWLVKSGQESFVLRCWAKQEWDSIDYEIRVMAELGKRGWKVPFVQEVPIESAGRIWSLSPYLKGDVSQATSAQVEQRDRGRLLAEFHGGLSQLSGFGQRPGWQRCETFLRDESFDLLLGRYEDINREYAYILRWHLQRSRERLENLKAETWPGMVVHGDFTSWNLRFLNGQISGILDFELCHWDHRIGEFPLAWRGRYDEVIQGYHEVSPLTPQEFELLTPLWWAFLLSSAFQLLQKGESPDDWILRKLLQRSPLMGPDAKEFRHHYPL